MSLIEITGWRLHYITHEIGLPSLIVLMRGGEKAEPKAKGLLADQNLDLNALKDMGFDIL